MRNFEKKSFSSKKNCSNRIYCVFMKFREDMLNVGDSFVFILRKFIRSFMKYGGLLGTIKKIVFELKASRIKQSYGMKSFPDDEEIFLQKRTKFPQKYEYSILLPVYNTPRIFLNQAIDSVIAQTYEKWELCIVDGSDKENAYVGEICKEYAKRDKRIVYKKIVNGGIAQNTNECFKMAKGEYVGFFDHDDLLHPSILYEYNKVACEQNADFIYCDEATFCGNNVNKLLTLHFKPDYALDNLRANNYICHFSVFKRELVQDNELEKTCYNGSQDHDVILRLTEKANSIVHVPKLLYYWRAHKGSVAMDIKAKPYAIDAAKEVVKNHLLSHGFTDFEVISTKAFPTIFKINYKIEKDYKVSIIIPFMGNNQLLLRCINTILSNTSYENYEVLIVESENYNLIKDRDELLSNVKTNIIKYNNTFNYFQVINFAVERATGEYVVFLHEDTEIITYEWIQELLMYAQREDVGAVGAKLLYRDKRIQNAGIVIGLEGDNILCYPHYKLDYNNLGYMGKLSYAQNVSAISTVGLMIKKELFFEVEGFDPQYSYLGNIDFCLKLREKNLYNVLTPFCELYHFDSDFLNLDNINKIDLVYKKRFISKWEKILSNGDPFYNKNFDFKKNNYSIKKCGK